MHCSFVFPESGPRPYKNNNMVDKKDIEDWLKKFGKDFNKTIRDIRKD